MATQESTLRNPKPAPAATAAGDVPFGVNEVRLGVRQWLVAAVIILGCVVAAPRLWRRIEPLETGPDYRMPFALNEDYWVFQRRQERLADTNDVPVLGDSVMWGQYVTSDQTLVGWLNAESAKVLPSPIPPLPAGGRGAGGEGVSGNDGIERMESGGTRSARPTLPAFGDGKASPSSSPSTRFANCALNGAHPAALLGLLEHYAPQIAGRKVLLHCNLLWMADKRRDLQDKRAQLNHPGLLPQMFVKIPCYNESLEVRLGVAIRREVPLFGWVRHLQIAYFDSRDVPAWTLDHPYRNPLSAITLALPSPDDRPSPPAAIPWTKAGLEKFSPPWVELETSFQWRCFRRTVELLEARGNRVFVLVGPFNEHMLSDASRRTYRQRLGEVEAWLTEQQIPHLVASLLPSDDYADASHPLADGYRKLAREMLGDERFAAFLRE